MILKSPEDLAADRKRSGSGRDNSSPKKRKIKSIDVDLPDAPLDGKSDVRHNGFPLYDCSGAHTLDFTCRNSSIVECQETSG